MIEMHCIKGCKCLLNTLIPLGSKMTLAKKVKCVLVVRLVLYVLHENKTKNVHLIIHPAQVPRERLNNL